MDDDAQELLKRLLGYCGATVTVGSANEARNSIQRLKVGFASEEVPQSDRICINYPLQYRPAVRSKIGTDLGEEGDVKSDRVFRKLNALALFSVPLLLGTQLSGEQTEKPPATTFPIPQRLRSVRESRLGLNSRIVCETCRLE